MQIKQKKYSGLGAEYIELYGLQNKERIFACEAVVKRENKGDKWSKWTISFSSCNYDIDFMEKRVKVINEAMKLARKLNKN